MFMIVQTEQELSVSCQPLRSDVRYLKWQMLVPWSNNEIMSVPVIGLKQVEHVNPCAAWESDFKEIISLLQKKLKFQSTTLCCYPKNCIKMYMLFGATVWLADMKKIICRQSTFFFLSLGLTEHNTPMAKCMSGYLVALPFVNTLSMWRPQLKDRLPARAPLSNWRALPC